MVARGERTRRRRAWSAILAAALVAAACSDPVQPPAIGPSHLALILDSVRTEHNLPALAGAIVTRDGVWGTEAVGVRRAGGSTPVTLADRFHLGSNLKAATSGLVGMLVDEGRIAWTTTVAEVFPELVGLMRPEYRDITLRELLTQQSGLREGSPPPMEGSTPGEQRERYVPWLLQQPSSIPRGRFHYTNANYVLAGAMVERRVGTSFESLITARLFAPLGATTVGFGAAGTPGIEDQPWGHNMDWSGYVVAVPPGPSADNPPWLGPAGRAHMSIGDWARYVHAVLRAEGGDETLWERETSRTLSATAVPIDTRHGYAMGWITTRQSWAGPTQRVLTHAGSNTLHASIAWVAPDAGFAVLVVTNLGGSDAVWRALDVAAVRMLSLYQSNR